MAEYDDLKRLVQLAEERGDRDTALKAMQRMKEIQSTAASVEYHGPTIQEKTEQAQLAAPRATPGVIFMGRGFQNLLDGLSQIGTNLAERTGELTSLGIMPETAEYQRRQLAQRRASEDPAYGALVEKYGPGSALVGELVGETAPFVMTPVPRVVGGFASRPLLGMPLRASPEASVGALEGQLRYYEPDESRAEGATGDAVAAALTRGIAERFARRSNAARGIMEDDELTELHQLGREMDVPVREGFPEDQAQAAARVAGERTVAEYPGALAEEAVQDLQGQISQRASDFAGAYDSLFAATAAGRVNLAPLKNQIQGLMEQEMARGSHARNALTAEYRKWLDTPEDALTPQKLQEFRTGLRETIRGLPGEQREAADALSNLENMVTDTLVSEMDRAVPGAGAMLRNMDTWYYEDLARIRRMPGVTGALRENPTPQNFMSWLIGKPSGQKRQVFDMLSDTGKDAVRASFWNAAWRKANQTPGFKPLQYAKFLEDNMETATEILEPLEAAAVKNTAKLFRHIGGEGKAADVSFWNFIRGFPFLYRSAAQNLKKSNFLYMMSNASPDLKPGSPAMDRFYRGVLRNLAISDAEEVREGYSQTATEAQEAIGPLFP